MGDSQEDMERNTLRLSEAPRIPAAYRETIATFLEQYWHDRRWQMEQDCGVMNLPLFFGERLLLMPLAEQLAEIARGAAGEMPDEMRGEVYECCQELCEHLFATPGLSNVYDIPERFWEAPMGQMVARCFVWLEGDELLTIKQASDLTGLSLSDLSQRIDRGELRAVIDPDAANPQRGRRLVHKRDVEALKDAGDGYRD